MVYKRLVLITTLLAGSCLRVRFFSGERIAYTTYPNDNVTDTDGGTDTETYSVSNASVRRCDAAGEVLQGGS